MRNTIEPVPTFDTTTEHNVRITTSAAAVPRMRPNILYVSPTGLEIQQERFD